jgi:hypothetical protein
MGEVILGAVASLLGIAVVYLIVRGAERNTGFNRQYEELLAAQREAKRLQGQLEGRSQKYSQKAQEVSKKDTKNKAREQRVQQLQEELQGLRSEHTKQSEQIKDMSRELNRLRIAREEHRAELEETRKAAAEAPRPIATTVADSAPAAPAPELASEPAGERPARNVANEEREVDRARKSIERLEAANHRLKQAVVERESALRRLGQKAEHNRRAYVITQLQLDLVNDEVYTLKHGHPPEHPQAEKSPKREALKPKVEQVIPNPDQAEPIDLTGVGFEVEEDLGAPIDIDEDAVEEVLVVDTAGTEPEPVSEAAVAEEEPVVLAEEAPAAPAKKPRHKPTTRLRKSPKSKTEAPAGVAAESADDFAPPRPAANP